MIYLPDTNVFSRYLRGRKEDAVLCDNLERNLSFSRLSAIALSELEYRAEKRPDLVHLRERIRRLRALFDLVDAFDAEAASAAGLVRAYLARMRPNAQPIGPYDVLLAGHALALGAILVTHNTREFARVPGLKLEDWQGR